MQSLEVIAPAKINLVLSVLDRRPDGYHNIWSLMQMLELHDSLFLSYDGDAHTHKAAGARQKPLPITLECNNAQLPCNETNLVHRAARAVMEKAGIQRELYIKMTKRIPIAAGLGGGSSDAAATIHGLNRLLHLGWGNIECAQLGAEIGSDVPFFFHGPTSIVRGEGSHVFPVTITTSQWVVLVKPPFDISTTWAYAQLDDRKPLLSENNRFSHDEDMQNFLQSPRSTEELYPYCWNAFEQIMERQFPVLAGIRQEHRDLGADIAMLSGSGSTVFGFYRSEVYAKAAEKKFLNHANYQAWTTTTKVSTSPLKDDPAG